MMLASSPYLVTRRIWLTRSSRWGLNSDYNPLHSIHVGYCMELERNKLCSTFSSHSSMLSNTFQFITEWKNQVSINNCYTRANYPVLWRNVWCVSVHATLPTYMYMQHSPSSMLRWLCHISNWHHFQILPWPKGAAFPAFPAVTGRCILQHGHTFFQVCLAHVEPVSASAVW